jgi:cell fate regulator YaaT (PSP1 superfamily)
MKSPLTICLLQTIENHRTPMKIKYCEINTDKHKAITYMTAKN